VEQLDHAGGQVARGEQPRGVVVGLVEREQAVGQVGMVVQAAEVPGPTDALSRRKYRAVVPPNRTPAASSWVTPDGLRASFFAGTATYSACAPILVPVMPHTSSPGAKSPTPAPTSSTTPENEPPRIGRRGRDTPNARRAIGPNPAGNRAPRMRASPEVTATASTRTTTSPARAAGRGTSTTRTTSGGPYRSTTAALMSRLYHHLARDRT